LSSTSATRTAREHDLGPPDPRPALSESRTQLAPGWETSSRRGWGPVRFFDHRIVVAPDAPHRPEASPWTHAQTQVRRRMLAPDASRASPCQGPRGSRRSASPPDGRLAGFDPLPVPGAPPLSDTRVRQAGRRTYRGSFSPTRMTRTPPVAQSPCYRSETRHHRSTPWPKPRRRQGDSAARALLSRKSFGLGSPPVDPLARTAREHPLAETRSVAGPGTDTS